MTEEEREKLLAWWACRIGDAIRAGQFAEAEAMVQNAARDKEEDREHVSSLELLQAERKLAGPLATSIQEMLGRRNVGTPQTPLPGQVDPALLAEPQSIND